jgi:hypothetical protein
MLSTVHRSVLAREAVGSYAPTALGYHDNYVVDGGKRRTIFAALVTPADVMENVPLRDLLWRVCFRRKIWLHHVTGDTTYGTAENIVALEDPGIRDCWSRPVRT